MCAHASINNGTKIRKLPEPSRTCAKLCPHQFTDWISRSKDTGSYKTHERRMYQGGQSLGCVYKVD